MWSKAMATESLEFELVAPPRRCCCVAMFVLLSFFQLFRYTAAGVEATTGGNFYSKHHYNGIFMMKRTRATRRQHNTVNKQAENSMKIHCSCLKDNSRVRESSQVDGGVKSSLFSQSKYLWEFIFEQTVERQQREPLEPASTGLQFTSVRRVCLNTIEPARKTRHRSRWGSECRVATLWDSSHILWHLMNCLLSSR